MELLGEGNEGNMNAGSSAPGDNVRATEAQGDSHSTDFLLSTLNRSESSLPVTSEKINM